MEMIGAILNVMLVIGLGFIFTLLVSGIFMPVSQLRAGLEHALNLVAGGLVDPVRQASRTVLQVARRWMRTAARSVGICGEHYIQRSAGMILLAGAGILGLVVGFLNLAPMVGGLLGEGAETIMNLLPIPLETLMAAELLVAPFVFGILILDLAGWTHLTKFYGRDHLTNPWHRGVQAIILLAGFTFSIYLLSLSGPMRVELLEQTNTATETVETGDFDTGITVPGSSPSGSELGGETLQSTTPEVEMSEAPSLPQGTSLLLTGLPVVAAVTSVYTVTLVAAALGMLLTVPLFLAVAIPTGIVWGLASLAYGLFNVLYNFLLWLVNVAGGLGRSLGEWLDVEPKLDEAPEASAAVAGNPGPQRGDPSGPAPDETSTPGSSADPGSGAEMSDEMNGSASAATFTATRPDEETAPDRDREPADAPQEMYGPDNANWNPLANDGPSQHEPS